MNNRGIVLKLLEVVFFPILLCGQLFSFAGVGDSGALTISAPGFFAAPQTSSWGKSSLSFYSKMRSTRNNLPLQKLEDAKALESAGAKIRKDFAVAVNGTVDCVVSDVQTKSPLGFFELERRDVWASLFLKEQDAADVQVIRAIVRAWKPAARKAFTECDLVYSGNIQERNARYAENSCVFYGQKFAPSAVYHMALREIAPSKAVYALHHGREEKASGYTIRDLWAVRRYRDLETNTQILTWRSSLDKNTEIVAVAYASNDHVEPVPGAEGLLHYTKNKKLRQAFSAQELEHGEKDKTLTENNGVEKTKSVPLESPEPDEPDNDKDSERDNQVDKACEKIDENRKHHILQEHHCWEKIIKNPRENWSEIVKIIKEVIRYGKEKERASYHGNQVLSRTLKIKEEFVEVRFTKSNGVISSISNAMVVSP